MENNVNNQRKIVILEDNGKVSFNLEGKFVAEDVVLICNTVILSAMNQLVANYEKTLEANAPDTANKDAQITELKGMLYDFYNVNASNLLTMFAPDIEQHPDLTAQAILKAENELIEEKYNELEKTGKLVPLKTVPKAKKIDIEQE